MPLSRRRFLGGAAAAAGWPLALRVQAFSRFAGAAAPAWQSTASRSPVRGEVFRHGVASGDPGPDRVVLWTRVTPAPGMRQDVPVTWEIATDEHIRSVVASGTAMAAADRDFTVKVDAGGLETGRTYYYAFTARGERSRIGRTRTLPERGAMRVRFAAVSCSNYPAGFFNVYRLVAARDDLDAVLHLGDYIYEFADGIYGDSTSSGRDPLPPGEAVSLDDYRQRYAIYRSDIDLQEAHARHPFVAVWDDHELANDTWRGGASNHDESEGDWTLRRAAAYRAYLEWMPVREPSGGEMRLYRAFRFGDLVDLLMLDTRSQRDRQLFGATNAEIAAPHRSLLGADQETWLFERLRRSHQAGTGWRVLGQQVLFSPITPPVVPVVNPDTWDGYPAARARILELIERERIGDVAILTGDLHSSWALDVPRDPWNGYERRSGAGALAVELVTPAISSPPLFGDPALRDQAVLLQLVAPHLKYLDGERRGYVLVDITRDRLQAEWYFAETVAARSGGESKGATFVCERGSSHLVPG